MHTLSCPYRIGNDEHSLDLVFVEGTRGRRFPFGDWAISVDVPDFFIATTATTQAMWTCVMETNPSCVAGDRRPVENVSWRDVANPGGFLDRLNGGSVPPDWSTAGAIPSGFRFRLPTETEWEYAARGGPHWADGFRFSGDNDVGTVAWFKDNSGDVMHDVGLKIPNRLGLFDMSGNTWEWCEDVYTADVGAIPRDGTPYRGEGDERVLRGGCFHNWAVHCTVAKRYEIGERFHDGCIGFRLVLAKT
jgi:formylglycine-generating enzyme required for sulfatase activity